MHIFLRFFISCSLLYSGSKACTYQSAFHYSKHWRMVLVAMRCNHSFTLEPNQWEVYQLCTYFNKIIVQLQLNALKVLNTEFSKKCLCKYSNISCYSSIISIRQNYNFDMSAMIWHELLVDFWKFTKIWKGLQHRNTELFLFWFLDVQNNFMFPHSRTIKSG